MDFNPIKSGFEQGKVFLVLVDYNNFRKIANRVTQKMLETEKEGIYFTADRGYKEVLEDLEYIGADAEDLYFIDVVSKRRNCGEKSEKVELIQNPTAFNDINLAFSKFYEISDSDEFVIIDSFTCYLLYGSLKPIGNFIKEMSEKASKRNATFIILAMKTQLDEEVISKLESIADKTVDYSEVEEK